MRLSRLFGNTLREAPSDAETPSHKLLVRAGFIRQLAAGIYTYLPLGWRVALKISQIMREEMDRIGGQELFMSVLHPAELWQESGRWYEIGPELMRVKDRGERDFALGMTHEEVITDLARHETRSYRQLPYMVYQIQTKIRDEPRSRGGLIRVREFLMKDAYSFHADAADLDAYYPTVVEAYQRIFSRCGVNAMVVEADPGMMGGSGSHEFIVLTDSGEDSVVICSNCGYAANLEVAQTEKPSMSPDGPELPIEEVSTPGVKAIADLARFVNVPASQCLKSVLYSANGQVVLALIRGDLEINEAKLRRALHAAELRLASADELAARGILAGFVSPVGQRKTKVLIDDSVVGVRNAVAGGNTPDVHLLNVNYPRDFQADMVVDIAVARAGDRCPRCHHPAEVRRGIEAGHTFKLGTKYTDAFGVTYL
ncbi:MAG: proline--tRNA ligase, partial [Chloroflexi bacterium]|nr:proline--tRNA ligase [Chloroflexota bacterium]